MRFIKSKSLQC